MASLSRETPLTVFGFQGQNQTQRVQARAHQEFLLRKGGQGGCQIHHRRGALFSQQGARRQVLALEEEVHRDLQGSGRRAGIHGGKLLRIQEENAEESH